MPDLQSQIEIKPKPRRPSLARRVLHRAGIDIAATLATCAWLHRPGLPYFRGIYGPRQLGDGPGRRFSIRLQTSLRYYGVEPAGNFAAGAIHQAGRGDRAGPGAGLPRTLQQASHDWALDLCGNRHRGLRPGRSHWLRHRAATSFRHSASRRRSDYKRGCA